MIGICSWRIIVQWDWLVMVGCKSRWCAHNIPDEVKFFTGWTHPEVVGVGWCMLHLPHLTIAKLQTYVVSHVNIILSCRVGILSLITHCNCKSSIRTPPWIQNCNQRTKVVSLCSSCFFPILILWAARRCVIWVWRATRDCILIR